MFNSIAGVVAGIGEESLFLRTGGVEWEIGMPAYDLARMPEAGEECRVFTWLWHREDAMRLFGFADEARRETFLELLKVDGIGPKGALRILGGIGRDDLERALESGDLARLEALPGLGKKTAQKMILALKGRLVRSAEPASGRHADLVQALVQMGFDRKAASDAVAKAESGMKAGLSPAEQEKFLFKEAIVLLSGAGG